LCGEARKILTPDKMEKKHPDPGEDWRKNQLVPGQVFVPFGSPYVHFYRDILP
jgi:hypothetical protein